VIGDKQTEARSIIETAMAELQIMGLHRDGAAALLVVQGFLRIEGSAERKEIIEALLALEADTGP
jgi:hypothetical protein